MLRPVTLPCHPQEGKLGSSLQLCSFPKVLLCGAMAEPEQRSGPRMTNSEDWAEVPGQNSLGHVCIQSACSLIPHLHPRSLPHPLTHPPSLQIPVRISQDR